jgi:UrcA family protein
MTRNCLRLAAAAAALAGAAIPAAAAPRGEAFHVSIPVGDLDLASQAGREALTRRARTLAARTCAPRPFPASYEPASLRACLRAFDAAARTAIDRGSRS